MINLFPPKSSLKNLIINSLVQGQGNIKEIKKSIKRDHDVSVTYQGIHKILNFLKQEDIVGLENHVWTLNNDWVNHILDGLNDHNRSPLFNPELKSISFSTMGKALKFISENIERIRNNGPRLFIMHVKNIAFLSLDNKQKNLWRRFARNNECHLLIEKRNFLNKLSAKYIKSLGFNVYLGIPRSTPYTLTVYGNTMYNTYSDFDITGFLTSTYRNIKTISNIKALKLFNSLNDDTRFHVKFIFETDEAVVRQTREYLIDLKNKN